MRREIKEKEWRMRSGWEMDEWMRKRGRRCWRKRKKIKSGERKLETMKRSGGNWRGNEIEMIIKEERFRTERGGTKSLETNLITRKYWKKTQVRRELTGRLFSKINLVIAFSLPLSFLPDLFHFYYYFFHLPIVFKIFE